MELNKSYYTYTELHTMSLKMLFYTMAHRYTSLATDIWLFTLQGDSLSLNMQPSGIICLQPYDIVTAMVCWLSLVVNTPKHEEHKVDWNWKKQNKM